MGRFHSFPVLKKNLVYFLVFITTAFLTGCNYYISKRIDRDKFENYSNNNFSARYLVVHLEKDAWHLKNPRVEENKLVGVLDTLEQFRRQYLDSPPGKILPYESEHKSILQEIHIIPSSMNTVTFLSEGGEQRGSLISMPLESEVLIYMLKPDNSYEAIGITAAFFVIVVIPIILIINELDDWDPGSCPFAYAFNGQQFTFEGELFSSALSPNLERDDYLPLQRLAATDGQYRIMLSNELMEQHFIDQATLRVIQHPEGTKALIGQDGQPIVFSSFLPPSRAESSNGLDISSQVVTQDMNTFKFDEPNSSFNSAILTFDKPENAGQMNLWLAAKNSYWLDVVWEEYTQKFGGLYPGFQEKLAQKPPETPQKWAQNQGIPLAVYLETGPGEWQLTEYLLPSGPFSMRNMAAAIDLSRYQGNTVRIKLEAGFNFWELDCAAADFSAAPAYNDLEIMPQAATGSDGIDYAATLSQPDGDYLSFPGPGHRVWISFEAPPVTAGMRQTAFLHGKGYYHLIRDYKGLPELGDLRHAKKPGFLPELSRELYSHQL